MRSEVLVRLTRAGLEGARLPVRVLLLRERLCLS